MAMDGTDGLTAAHDFQSVIFDFDYTLADSSDAVIECANYALRRLGLPEATDDAIRRTIGLSLPRTLTALAGEEHARHGDEFQRLFTERADVVMHDLIVMYDFVPSITDALMGSGIRLGIVSSKFRRRIERVLKPGRSGGAVRGNCWRRGCERIEAEPHRTAASCGCAEHAKRALPVCGRQRYGRRDGTASGCAICGCAVGVLRGGRRLQNTIL